MAEFSIGSKVVQIDTDAHGVVVEVCRGGRGRQLYKVSFPSGVSTALEADLRADFDETDPFECCKSGIFASYADYSRINTSFKIQNSNNSTISSLKASKTLFRAYQFKPLLKFLNSTNRRILVADEVGLGKTIEAGHVMLELKARNELRNALIICPKSLQLKWKAEMYEKFGLDFEVCDDTKDLIESLYRGTRPVRCIINYERIRQKTEKPNAQEGKQKHPNLIDFLRDNPTRFSIVLCDEAHKLRNSSTQTYKGAKVIMECADSAMFLTATPVMINEENLYNLLHLLDERRYFNYQIFRNRLEENRPFVEALSKLNNQVPFPEILRGLVAARIHTSFSNSDDEQTFYSDKSLKETYGEDPLFQEILDLLEGEDTDSTRARLQYLISSMSVMNTVFSRTRKREVTTDMSQAERKPHPRKVVLHEKEREEFDRVIEEYREDNSEINWWGEESLTPGGALGLVQKKRQVASSVWGYLNDETDLDRGRDAYAQYPDAKVEELISIIEKVFSGGTHKLVIFALFRRTLKYLSIRLKKAGYNSLIIHGQVSSDDRHEIIERFKNDDNSHILLSSEVGSEGLDMQFCNSMVNYDLPWNPMVIEQRIGRIDRFGQKSEVVNIYNLIVADSIQEEIFMRLLNRIGIFRGTIGDMEAILDAPFEKGSKLTIQDVYNKMEKEFFTTKLTSAERERKLAEIDRAIANEKEELKHLKSDLKDALTNDAYFQNEINRILTTNAYVTGPELRNFLESVLRLHLSTCSIKALGGGVMEFQIPISQPTILRNFLTAYGEQRTDEDCINLNGFKRRIDDKTSFLFTFEQSVAYDNPTLIYLNIYHPLIRACVRFLSSIGENEIGSFSYGLKSDDLLKGGTRYYMGVYKLTTTQKRLANAKENVELLPVVYDIDNNSIVTDKALSDRLYRNSQDKGHEKNASNSDLDPDLIDNMRYDFTAFVSDERKRRMEERNKQAKSDRLRNAQQTVEYYQSRIDGFIKLAEDVEYQLSWVYDEQERGKLNNTLRLHRGNISRLERERDERLASINEDPHLAISDNLLSLSLISIN